MSAIANSLQKPEPFDLYVKKFRSICVMHGVQIGSGTDLPGFMQKLMANRHLAMDFWAFVSKLSNREGGQFSDDQVLAVVTEGVTGGQLSAADGEQKGIVDNLRAMLAGVDIQGTEQGVVELAPFPRSQTSSRQTDGEVGIHAVELPLRASESRTAFMREEVDREAAQNAALPPTPPQLDEGLLRLELTRLLERYLSNLDKSKLESPPEEVAPIATDASPTIRQSLEVSVSEEREELILKPIGSTRLVLEPAASPVEDSLATETEQETLPVRVPFEDYSQSAGPGYGKAVLLLILVLVLFGAAFAAYRYRTPLLREMSVLIQDIRQKTGTAASSIRTASPATAPRENASALQPEVSQQPEARPVVQSTSTPPPANIDASKLPQPTAFVGSQAAAGGSGSSNQKATTDHAPVQAEPAPPNEITNADLAGAVQVAPAVMETYLIASRVPVYPETAKIDGIEGSVVMQAIISKSGTVKRVHVTQGDPHLRSAAAEAVYRWRYRPYLLDGQPVEVATTITVDFDLNR